MKWPTSGAPKSLFHGPILFKLAALENRKWNLSSATKITQFGAWKGFQPSTQSKGTRKPKSKRLTFRVLLGGCSYFLVSVFYYKRHPSPPFSKRKKREVLVIFYSFYTIFTSQILSKNTQKKMQMSLVFLYQVHVHRSKASFILFSLGFYLHWRVYFIVLYFKTSYFLFHLLHSWGSKGEMFMLAMEPTFTSTHSYHYGSLDLTFLI